MKTLILNGSPRKDGDTATLLNEFREHVLGEVVEISAYRDSISACIDCRSCWKVRGCALKDDMAKIYADDYDVLLIASPVYMYNLPGPMMSLASRFQVYYAASRFLNDPIVRNKKKASLILVAGGNGGAWPAIESAKLMFKTLNADFDDINLVTSLKTDTIPAKDDPDALKKVREMAIRLNESF